MFIVNYIIVTRPLNKQDISVPEINVPDNIINEYNQNTVESTGCSSGCPYYDIDLSGLPAYYYNPFALLLGAFSSLFWVLALAIMSQAVLWGIIAILFLIKKKECKCPKCKKKFRYKKNKPERCMYCGAKLNEDLKAH